MANSDATGWSGLLDRGENILWQGRPSGRVHLGLANIPLMLFGLFFAGFALFWMKMASGAGGNFWMFGLIHFTVGVAIVLFPLLGQPMLRRRSFYTLTNRRAFIGTDLPLTGRRLRSWVISPQTMLELIEYPDGLGTVNFALAPSTATYRRRRRAGGRSIGFQRIGDASRVYAMMSKIQKDAA